MTANLSQINYFHLLSYIENKGKENGISWNKSMRESLQIVVFIFSHWVQIIAFRTAIC